ncbi:septation protein SepH [Ornithinimicrobium tianjinense]|nr:septation protein SepH [Ornithinimicrobium tianjinense]
MQQLQFDELDEGGRLVLVADDGTRYAVPVDDRLRAALRPRPHAPSPERPGGGATPREVQAMIRAGQTAQEVASATGWDLVRVQRFEGPVLAEREHVVGLAQAAAVRAQGRTDGSHRLDQRVRERLTARGVPEEEISWDAARSAPQGPWTVLVVFPAGGRERRAAWHYDVQDRSIEALDDEARWLSEDEQALPGGLAGHPLLGAATATDEANDLMATMRARRQQRGSGRRTRRVGPDAPAPGGRPADEDDVSPPTDDRPGPRDQGRAGGGLVDEVLPLEDFEFDEQLQQAGEPPAAHPRGSAPESPSPVTPEEDETEAPEGSEDPTPLRPARRRRLRMPKLPPVVGEPAQGEEDGEPEGTFARTQHDPNEVSFEEFFGMDEEDDLEVLDEEGDLPEEVVAEDPDPEPDDVDEVEDVEDVEDVDEPDADAPAAEQPAPKKGGRTSVPSWDDIMFGSGPKRRQG